MGEYAFSEGNFGFCLGSLVGFRGSGAMVGGHACLCAGGLVGSKGSGLWWAVWVVLGGLRCWWVVMLDCRAILVTVG